MYQFACIRAVVCCAISASVALAGVLSYDHSGGYVNTTELYGSASESPQGYPTVVVQDLQGWPDRADRRLAHSRVQETLNDCARVFWNDGHRLCDPGMVLTDGNIIEEILEDLCRHTKCPCEECPAPAELCGGCQADCPGFPVTVVVISDAVRTADPTVEYQPGPSTRDAGKPSVPLRPRAADSAGPRACYDHVSIFLFTNESPQLYTVVGSDAQRVLTGFCTDEVETSVSHMLSHGRYAEALLRALGTYRELMSGKRELNCNNMYPFVLPTSTRIVLIYASVCIPLMSCVVLVFIGPCFRGRGFGGKKHRTEYTFTYSKRLERGELLE